MTTHKPLESYLSDRVQSVPPSGIRRFFEIAATMEDVITLGIGEPDFVSPQPIIDACLRFRSLGFDTVVLASASEHEVRVLNLHW